jgi:hypothetical protein
VCISLIITEATAKAVLNCIKVRGLDGYLIINQYANWNGPIFKLSLNWLEIANTVWLTVSVKIFTLTEEPIRYEN